MKTKAITTIMITLFLASIMAIAVPVSAEYGTPTIDGVISAGEWGDPTFQNVGYFNVYVLNDEGYLYVGFETLGGTYLPEGDGTNGMINVYAMDLDGETWAYCWHHRFPTEIKLYHSSPTIPRHEDPTSASFGVTETVFELQIPLSELLTLSLGDGMKFHFLSYAEGMSDWGSNTWLYDQEYTLVIPPAYWVKASGGGEFYDDYPDFTGHHCTIGLIGMSLTAVPEGVTTDYKGSGVFVDHYLKLIIHLDITTGRLTTTAKKEVQFWGTARVKDINLKDKWTGTFWVGLVDDEYGVTNRFAIHLWPEVGPKYGVWHGTLLPESEVTVWFWQ